MIGDLAPAANEFIFGNYVKPLILKAWDVTYVEYHRRGLEEFPEEIPPASTGWTATAATRSQVVRGRDAPAPATTGSTAWWFASSGPGRTTAPEAVEMLGQNLSPARSR